MSISNTKKTNCCGCNACAEICPKHCIKMIADSKGFLYPKVNHAVCIECGVCEKVCPFQKENISLHAPIKAFAAWNKDREKHISSSSGGAAYVLSEYIIRSGGVVYGCTSDSMRIRHIRVDSLSNLSKLQGSKYVQSDVRGLFGRVKADLKADIPVLFIGTPCQVTGLKNYIKRIPEHLYLVDLICHGVPSQQMLHEHINHIMKGRSAVQLSFRKGQLYRIEMLSRCGTVYSSEPYGDTYFRAFLDGISYRESCYHCPFARKERVSDITIGDFWGLRDADKFPSKSEEGGISVLLPSSVKGEMLINAIKTDMYIYERSVEEAVTGNDQLQSPVKDCMRNRVFRTSYTILPFEQSIFIATANHKFKTLLKIVGRKIHR